MSDEAKSVRYARTWATGTITGDLLHTLAGHVDRLTRERDSAREAVRELTRERDEARETIRALNRRCQSAESGLAHALDAAGDRTFGRALANCAASMYREQNRELVEALRPFAELSDGLVSDPHPCLERCWRVGGPAGCPDGVCVECGQQSRSADAECQNVSGIKYGHVRKARALVERFDTK